MTKLIWPKCESRQTDKESVHEENRPERRNEQKPNIGFKGESEVSESKSNANVLKDAEAATI